MYEHGKTYIQHVKTYTKHLKTYANIVIMKPLLPLAWVIARCLPACCPLPAAACRATGLQAAAGCCSCMLLLPVAGPLQGGECSLSDFRDHSIGGGALHYALASCIHILHDICASDEETKTIHIQVANASTDISRYPGTV